MIFPMFAHFGFPAHFPFISPVMNVPVFPRLAHFPFSSQFKACNFSPTAWFFQKRTVHFCPCPTGRKGINLLWAYRTWIFQNRERTVPHIRGCSVEQSHSRRGAVVRQASHSQECPLLLGWIWSAHPHSRRRKQVPIDGLPGESCNAKWWTGPVHQRPEVAHRTSGGYRHSQ